jgi:glucosamine--fructose-6-phosphate aminotransferase (isomerizing)
MKEAQGEAETRAGEYLISSKEPARPKEIFLASDPSAVVEHTKKVMIIEDDEVVHIKV